MCAIPMRDGVKLYADVYRPVAAGKYGVIVCRTPYSTQRAPISYEEPVFFSSRGFVYVFQDVRGRHESEGKGNRSCNRHRVTATTRDRANIARQPWSNGKYRDACGTPTVGTCSGGRRCRSRRTWSHDLPDRAASTSLYHNWVTLDGAWRLSFNFGWGADRQESRVMQNTGIHSMKGVPESQRYDHVLSFLPLIGMQELMGRHAQFYTDWIHHPDYDDYWKKLNVEEVFEQIGIPIYTSGGWFDIFTQGTQNGYIGMSRTAESAIPGGAAHKGAHGDRLVGARRAGRKDGGSRTSGPAGC